MGKCYAKVLSTVHQKVKPENLNTEIWSIRKTIASDILLEPGCKIQEIEAVNDTLRKAIGEEATVINQCLQSL